MKKIFLLIPVLFICCQKKEVHTTKKIATKEQERGEYFSPYSKKESSVLKYKTDTLNLFYDGDHLNRVEIKTFNESFGDTPSGYDRNGYHINKENFLDATVYITDTLKVNTVSDYPRVYEERYEFYRKTYTISYGSFDGKKIQDYFKSSENPSKGYTYDLLSLDVALSKIDFPLEKMPKSLYNIKNNDYKIYAMQDSIKVYDIDNSNNYKIISSSIPFDYLRDIKVEKVGNTVKYFARISIKKSYKYIDLKEIEGIQVTNPHLEEERYVTAPNGLELYDNSQTSDCFGKKDFLIVKIPKGERVEVTENSGDYIYIDGKKGNLINVRYYNEEGGSKEGIAFSGYLSINKP
ncbi:hypothetical protein [uncultured Flavobacterium sp.]|uniref:hypothetical protein n=1 Tax=uncultured Flavobacterium sp. TaxID=165435 RepID=UPI003081D572